MYVHVSFGGFGVSETAMFGGMLDQMLLHNGKPDSLGLIIGPAKGNPPV